MPEDRKDVFKHLVQLLNDGKVEEAKRYADSLEEGQEKLNAYGAIEGYKARKEAQREGRKPKTKFANSGDDDGTIWVVP